MFGLWRGLAPLAGCCLYWLEQRACAVESAVNAKEWLAACDWRKSPCSGGRIFHCPGERRRCIYPLGQTMWPTLESRLHVWFIFVPRFDGLVTSESELLGTRARWGAAGPLDVSCTGPANKPVQEISRCPAGFAQWFLSFATSVQSYESFIGESKCKKWSHENPCAWPSVQLKWKSCLRHVYNIKFGYNFFKYCQLGNM